MQRGTYTRGSRGRGGGGGAGRNVFSSAPKGLFQNGTWQCDCNPRLPAVHFQTKKQGPNVGRWFYSCQKQQDDTTRCKFFLWESDAKPREQAALQNNSRTEPGRTNETPTRPQQRAVSPPPPYTIEASESSRKRTRTASAETEDDFDLDDDTFGRALDNARVAAETPRKAARTESHTTPRRRLPWETDRTLSNADGLPTPKTDTRAAKEPFTTRFAQPGGSFLTPSKYHEDEAERAERQTMTPGDSPFDTPTPTRFKDAVASGSDDIVQDVFALLQDEGVYLKTSSSSALKRLLQKHARRAEGANKGREVARLQIKAKDAKITELTHMNTTLQAELEAAKATMEHLTWERDNESDI